MTTDYRKPLTASYNSNGGRDELVEEDSLHRTTHMGADTWSIHRTGNIRAWKVDSSMTLNNNEAGVSSSFKYRLERAFRAWQKEQMFVRSSIGPTEAALFAASFALSEAEKVAQLVGDSTRNPLGADAADEIADRLKGMRESI